MLIRDQQEFCGTESIMLKKLKNNLMILRLMRRFQMTLNPFLPPIYTILKITKGQAIQEQKHYSALLLRTPSWQSFIFFQKIHGRLENSLAQVVKFYNKSTNNFLLILHSLPNLSDGIIMCSVIVIELYPNKTQWGRPGSLPKRL